MNAGNEAAKYVRERRSKSKAPNKNKVEKQNIPSGISA